MDAAKRLSEALIAANAERGKYLPQYNGEGKLTRYAKPLIEVRCGDVVEVCATKADRTQIVSDLEKGSATVAKQKSPDTMVFIQIDDLYHLLD